MRLLRLLEENNVGGIFLKLGGLNWKGSMRDLKAYGVEFLQRERRLIKDVRAEINDELFHLMQGKQPYDKGGVEKVISDIIKEKMHTSVVDYYIRKAIIAGEYDNETIHFFLTSNEIWDKTALQYLLNKKASRLGIKIKNRCSDHDDDFFDPEYLILLLDFLIDGVIDMNFINELNGGEINYISEHEGIFEKESVVERIDDSENINKTADVESEHYNDVSETIPLTHYETQVQSERTHETPVQHTYEAPNTSEPTDCGSCGDD